MDGAVPGLDDGDENVVKDIIYKGFTGIMNEISEDYPLAIMISKNNRTMEAYRKSVKVSSEF